MDKGTRTFWGLIAALLLASAFFGANAEKRRRAVQRGDKDVAVQTGDIVSFVRVVDGDTLLMQTGDGSPFALRLLGVKAFEGKLDKDPVARWGREAEDALRQKLDGQPVRVLTHSTPKDRHGRVIAQLFVGDHDIGLDLVKEGRVLVYTPYPFPAMSLYLQEQAAARADRRGLWADSTAVERADALSRKWGKEAQ